MEDILTKALEFADKYRITGRAHYLSASYYAKLNRLFGIPVIIITAVVGTTIFGTLEQNPNSSFKIAAGLISIVGTVLATLQTTLGFAQIAEKHKAAGETYRSMQRRFELFELKFKATGPEVREIAMNQLEDLVEKLDEVAKNFPAMSDRFYSTAKREIDARKTTQSHHTIFR